MTTPHDLRHLDPPQPLLEILAALESPGEGPYVFLLAREPRPLYALLAASGWRHRARRTEGGIELSVFRGDPPVS